MRTNKNMRRETLSNIQAFFQEAQQKLTVPLWLEASKEILAPYKIDPCIHWSFYDSILDRACLNIEGWGIAHFTLPENTYGYITGSTQDPDSGTYRNWSYALQLKAKPEDLDEDTQRFIRQHSEMHQASQALQNGATEALKETTVERALTRLPEIKRFLPERYRRG